MHMESKMSQSTTMTIRLEPELKSRLDKLSASTHRSKSFLAAEAVREFVEINEWQIEEIKNKPALVRDNISYCAFIKVQIT